MSEENKDKKELPVVRFNKRHRRITKSLVDEFKFSKFVIDCDNFDIRALRGILKHNPKLKKTYEEGKELYPPFEFLQQDVFNSLYKYDPHFLKDRDIDNEVLLNKEVMSMLMDTKEYKELRHITKLDKVSATLGTEILTEEVKNIIQDMEDKLQELMEQMMQAAQAQQQAQQQGEECQSCGGSGEDENGDPCPDCNGTGRQPSGGEGDDEEGEGSPQFTLKQAQEVMARVKAEVKQAVQDQIEQPMMNALNAAKQKTREVSSFIKNWSLGSDPSFMRSNYQDKMKKIDRLKSSHKLKEIAKLAGKYRRIALKSKRMDVKKAETVVQDITTGDDVSRMIASDAVLLQKSEVTKLWFFKKLIDHNIRQYQYGGEHILGKGPIVACIDSSGSMSGDAEVWSKAVALGLLDIAREQKRSMHVIHFSARDASQLHTNTFPKGKSFDVDEVIDMAEYFESGGTDFEEPLKKAREKVDEDEEFSKADIVFITDGNSAVRDDFAKEFNKWKSERNVSVYSVLINYYSSTSEALKLFSDRIVPLQTTDDFDGEEDNVAEGIFTHVK